MGSRRSRKMLSVPDMFIVEREKGGNAGGERWGKDAVEVLVLVLVGGDGVPSVPRGFRDAWWNGVELCVSVGAYGCVSAVGRWEG